MSSVINIWKNSSVSMWHGSRWDKDFWPWICLESTVDCTNETLIIAHAHTHTHKLQRSKTVVLRMSTNMHAHPDMALHCPPDKAGSASPVASGPPWGRPGSAPTPPTPRECTHKQTQIRTDHPPVLRRPILKSYKQASRQRWGRPGQKSPSMVTRAL